MPVKIITDSAADLPPELAKDLGVTIIPIRVNFGSEIYYDGVDLPLSGFLARLPGAQEPPTTSQPAPQSYLEAAGVLISQGYDVLIITLSSGVSGTYHSALLAAQQLPQDNVGVVDSRLVSAGQGRLVWDCALRAKEGATLIELTQYALSRRQEITMVAMLDTVEYLVAGGRLSLYKAYGAKKPGVRLIFTANDLGQAEILERAPGRRRALEALYQSLENAPRDWNKVQVIISHCDSLGDAIMVADWIKNRLGARPEVWATGSTVAAYVGPGAVLAAF
jgi:DegV family protein with EDD domain